MKKIAFLSLILPLAACATQQQMAQEKADLLARAQAVCGGNTNIRCLNGVLEHISVNMIVARQGDGSLTLKYARFSPHTVGGQVMPGDGIAAAADLASFNGPPTGLEP
jgi:hypothetical protein